MAEQDMEDAKIGRARGFFYRQLISARTVDRDVLVDRKLAAREHDTLPVERGIELNRVPVAGRGDRIAERTRAAVRRGGNDERARVKGLDAGHHRAKKGNDLRPA